MLSAMDFGRVAQSVEHLTFNQVAPGSSPGTLTNKTPQNESFCGVCYCPKTDMSNDRRHSAFFSFFRITFCVLQENFSVIKISKIVFFNFYNENTVSTELVNGE